MFWLQIEVVALPNYEEKEEQFKELASSSIHLLPSSLSS
jgi:hypothetical protein